MVALAPKPPPPETAPELQEGYYARNFEAVLETVLERYEDLLLPEELAYAQDFQALGEGAKRLYVRLVCRKGPCFRRDLLTYDDIDDLDRAAEELRAAGYLDGAEDAPLEDLAAVLRRPELADLVEALGLAAGCRGLRRSELWELLLQAEDPEAAGRRLRQAYDVWRPLHGERLLLFRLLFFGNLHQDLSELVIRDLGIVRYEDYPLSREHRLFQDREDVDQAFYLRQVRRQAHDLAAAGRLEEAVAPAEEVARGTWREAVRRQVDGLLIQVARELERGERFDKALELYAGALRPPSRERRCRVLEKLDRTEDALTLCEEMAAAPLDETEAAFAPFFRHRMRRKLGLVREPWKRPRRPSRELEVAPENRPVEALALEALAAEGTEGIFSENWLWRSLFGLAFWDVVFAPVSGVFHHPFQVGPWDLSLPEFRVRRQEAVAERLEELREERDLPSRLWPVYAAKTGIANALVPWHPGLEDGLRFALERVRGDTLATICDRLSRHLKRYRRGLPDLMVASDTSPVGFELLEVKGPGDQVRPEQGAWIDYLNRHGIPARVLKVRFRP